MRIRSNFIAFLLLSLQAKPFACNGNPFVKFSDWLQMLREEDIRIAEEERKKRPRLFNARGKKNV